MQYSDYSCEINNSEWHEKVNSNISSVFAKGLLLYNMYSPTNIETILPSIKNQQELPKSNGNSKGLDFITGVKIIISY